MQISHLLTFCKHSTSLTYPSYPSVKRVYPHGEVENEAAMSRSPTSLDLTTSTQTAQPVRKVRQIWRPLPVARTLKPIDHVGDGLDIYTHSHAHRPVLQPSARFRSRDKRALALEDFPQTRMRRRPRARWTFRRVAHACGLGCACQ